MKRESSIITTLNIWLVAAGWVYLTGLLGWLLLHLLTGDRLWFVSLSTSLIQVVFLPLPMLIAVAAMSGRRSLWVGSGATIIIWLALFGGLFNLPQSTARAATPTLRAMTYNVEFRNDDAEAVAETIRAANADLVGMQELTPVLAASLGPLLESEYPHQALDPRESVIGMGIFSRYPIEEIVTDEKLDSYWIGEPQAIDVELPEGTISALNVHFAQGRLRDLNAEVVAQWVATQPNPVVVLGDVNATDLSDAYDILAKGGLQDSWREAGWGYGSTFPTSSQRMNIGGLPIPAPARLVRIDYVFHTPEFKTLSVGRLDWDGKSDHLAVVAELALLDPIQ